MSIGATHKLESKTLGTVAVAGSITFGASGAITSVDSDHFSAADGGTGLCDITFTHAWAKLLGVSAMLDAAAASDAVITIETSYSATAGTISLGYSESDTPAYADFPSGDTLYLVFFMKKSDSSNQSP